MIVNNAGAPSPLRMFGLGSGMDIDEMVGKLMQAERIPLDRVLQQRQLLVWQKEAYQAVRLKLRELDEGTVGLRLSSTFSPRTVNTSNEAVVKATAQAGAPTGSHTLTVNSLARGLSLYSSAALPGASGTGVDPGQPLATQFSGLGATLELKVHYTVGASTQTAARTFDTAQATLSDVITWLNGLGYDLSATYDAENDRFFVAGLTTGTRTPDGAARSYQFEDSTGTAFFSTHLQLVDGNTGPSPTPVADNPAGSLSSHTGVNADVTIDGAPLNFAENTFTFGGVSYTLVSGGGATAQVTVAHDVDAVVAAVRSFVDLYNATIDDLNKRLREPRYYDYPPLTNAQKAEMKDDEIAAWEERAKSGMLHSDRLVNDALGDLRRAVTYTVAGTGSEFTGLADIGITTGSWFEYGKLHLDEAKLRAALVEDPAGVQAIFTKTGGTLEAKGIGQRLDEALKQAMDGLADRAGTTSVEADLSTALGRRIDDLDERAAAMEARLARREAYYYRQFSVMESFISQMNSQALWLAQQFGQGQG